MGTLYTQSVMLCHINHKSNKTVDQNLQIGTQSISKYRFAIVSNLIHCIQSNFLSHNDDIQVIFSHSLVRQISSCYMEVKWVGLNILYVAHAQKENESIGNTHINNFIFFHLKMLQNLFWYEAFCTFWQSKVVNSYYIELCWYEIVHFSRFDILFENLVNNFSF